MEHNPQIVEDFSKEIEIAALKSAPLFHLMNWTWDKKVPTSDEIEEFLYDSIKSFLKKKLYHGNYTSCGRFKIIYYEYDETPSLQILLELSNKEF